MNSSSIIMWFIIICIFLMFTTVLPKPFTLLLKFVIQSSVGIFLIILINLILSPFGVFVGINYITALIVGALGIPGLASLYILQLIL